MCTVERRHKESGVDREILKGGGGGDRPEKASLTFSTVLFSPIVPHPVIDSKTQFILIKPGSVTVGDR